MLLLLTRHGTAVPPLVDAEQPLSPEGKSEVEKLAKFLGHHSIPLSKAYSSPKTRAKETAQILVEHLSPSTEIVEFTFLKPNEGLEQVLEKLEDEYGNVLIVSHLPFLEKLVGELLVNDEHAQLVEFGPGTTVCLERESGAYTIKWVVSGNLL